MTRRSHWPVVFLSSIASLFGVFLPLILVRVLSTEEVGHFKIFFLYLMILPAFSLTAGVISGLAYWVGQAEKGRAAIKMSSMLLLILGTCLVGVALASEEYIALTFGWSVEQSRIFALAILGTVAASFFEEAAIATGRTWTGGLFYAGFELLRSLVIIVALFIYRDLTALLWAHTLVVTLKLFSGYVYGYRLNLVGFAFDPNCLKSVWRYAFPVSLAWVFGIFVVYADQFVLATTISTAQFAIYSIGCLTLAPLLMFEHSVTRVLIPQMSEALSQRQPGRAAVLYQSAIESLSFILIPAVVALIVFATPIIEICFTKQYSAASKYLQLFALTYLFLIIPYDALPRARGQSNWILKTFVVFSLISLGLAAVLASLFGPFGALSAILISGLLMRIYAIWYFQKTTSLPLRRFLPISSFIQYTIISLTLGGLALSVQNEFKSDYMWFLVGGSTFAFLYLLIALPMKNKSEHIRLPSRGLLVLTQTLNIGGLERMVLHLCMHIKEKKQWAVRVFAYDQTNPDTDSLLEEFAQQEIPVESFKKPRGFSLGVVARILRTVYRNDIQIVHSQDLGCLVYAALVKLLCFGKIAIVHTQHSFIHLQRAKRYRFYEKVLILFVDKLTVVSEDTRQTYLELGVPDQKINLVENGISFPENPITDRQRRIALRNSLAEKYCPSGDHTLLNHLQDTWILYVARFFPGKGQEHALKIWQALDPSVRKHSVLCFIGPPSSQFYFDQIKAASAETPDPARIFMLGASSDPSRWLRAGDVYLSCSEFEGMPLGPLEAVGAGMPTLVSQIAGHDFIKNESEQFLLSDINEGARRLETMLNQTLTGGNYYFQKLWDDAYPLRQKFSLERMGRKYSLLYADASSSRVTSFFDLGESYG